jgi:hypothetical protein
MPVRRLELGLVLLAAVAYGYFHPGGGWNQNGRFALVRALVEERRVAIDSFLVYDRASESTDVLRRLPLRDGVIDREGKPFVLTWTGIDRKPTPVSPAAPADGTRVKVEDVGVTGDVAFHRGHFHPNKAPGTSFAAVPAYGVLYGLERALGIDPDRWLVLTLNAWLTSWLSVGLISAAGLVLFHRLARQLSGHAGAALLATLGFGFGTLYWTYATMLREHNLLAIALLGAYACLRDMRTLEPSSRRGLLMALASGACAGAAVVANYISLAPAVLLAGYLLAASWRRRPVGPLAMFALGLSVPLLLLGLYHHAAFGRWLTTSYRYENPMFVSTSTAFLGILEWPQPERLLTLTVSPFRGLFVSSPILVLGVLGLGRLFKEREHRLDVLLFAAVIGFFLLFNISFNGWHGGWATGPRYLVPAFPFLALPMVRALDRPARWMWGLLGISIALNAFANFVDPDTPVGTAGHAMRPGVAKWLHSPLLDYQVPFFEHGQARPVLEAQRDELLAKVRGAWEKEGRTPAQIRDGLAAVRADVDGSIARGETEPFELARVRGFVSVNPLGIYESWYFRLFTPDSMPSRHNSFNVGEALLPGSRVSVVPLIAVMVVGMRALWRLAVPDATSEGGAPSPSRPASAGPKADRRRRRASTRPA